MRIEGNHDPHLRAGAWLLLAVSAFAMLGLPGLELNASYTAYFDDDDPLVSLQRELESEFAHGDTVAVILEARRGDFRNARHAALLHDLDARLRSLPAARDVVGPASSAASRFVSPHGDVALTVVVHRLTDPGAPDAILEAVEQIEREVERAIAASGLDVGSRLTGTLALNRAYIEVLRGDLAVFAPLLALLVFALLGCLFRCIVVPIAVGWCALLAVATAFGAAGWLRLELAALDAFAPVVITTIALAGAMHVVTRFAQFRSVGGSPADAMSRSLAVNRRPLALAAITTTLGFAGLALSPSPPVQVFGVLVAIGVPVAYLAIVLHLPRLLVRLDRPRHAPSLGQLLARASGNATRHRRFTVIVVVALTLGSLAALANARLDDNVFEYFPEQHPWRQANVVAERSLGGVNELSWVLDTGRPAGIATRELLLDVAEFADWLRAQPEILRVDAISEIPAVRAALDGARALDASSLAHVAGDDGRLARLMNADASATVVTVGMAALEAGRLLALEARISAWLNAESRSFEHRGATGAGLIFARLNHQHAGDMLTTMLLVIAVLLAIVAWMTRSLRTGAAAALANLLPIGVAFALWTAFGGPLSQGATAVLAMIVGVVVDDTLFMLEGISEHRGAPDATRSALLSVGPALWTTSVTLSLGFAIGMFSGFAPIVAMSTLSVAVTLLALASVVLVLPALIATPALPERPAAERRALAQRASDTAIAGRARRRS